MAEVIEEKTLLKSATVSLLRMQEFDVDHLPRVNELGSSLNFQNSIEPSRRLISLYRRLSTTALEDFPDAILTQIKAQCDADYQKFDQIIAFDPSAQQTPSTVRDTYMTQLVNAYDPAFNKLSPHISYSLHRSADFQRLDSDARSTFQQIKDEASSIQKSLEAQKESAEGILSDIRETAAEQGVTQQAIYFQTESSVHETDAAKWEVRTIWVASTLAVFAIASIFLHKWSWIAPVNTFETVQLVSSKLLIFGVLAYLLILSAKNYLNHKHNSIVNKHRQNALMTYKAMVDATDDPGSREAILIQAAGCIFNPQTTGYTIGGDTPAVSGKSMVEILSKPIVQAAASSNK
ncbi:hypothetical protein [Microbulbifer rhizosphaerae]|uniref:Uncharacterized protein n=1 Tax=Microbulbifer rhizosphaerae TaxID=1562603 RepID=A0A7W4Z7A6_9GAMM|nr:hypothetical protein [Microbulbifer rhizosphaerae]MBB3059276.1 hypothetical protein [Microbulbifer rhizosphaerae]